MDLTGVGAGTLERMAAASVAAADPDRIILFGSRARGGAAADSDADLMVVKEGPFGPERSGRTEAARLIRALADFPAAKDILACSREEVEYWRDSLNSVAAEALSEGEVLYERSRGSRKSPAAGGDALEGPCGLT